MKTTQQKFTAVVQDGHKGCAVEVPFDPTEVWGEQPTEVVYQRVRGIAVRGTINRGAFESWIIRRWGKFFLLLRDDVLDAGGTAAGEVVNLVVRPKADTSPTHQS